jgi:hypothetical protein
MAGPFGRTPGDLRHLSEEVRLLHDRLHRVVVAVALTEEVLADVFERLAAQGGERGTQRRLEAKRARARADECRAFALRLDNLGAFGTDATTDPT